MLTNNGQPVRGLPLPSGWQRLRLIDAVERITVGLAISVTEHYCENGVPLIRNQNICDGWFDGKDIVCVRPEFAQSQSSKAVRARDVLTVRTGANIGQTCVVPAQLEGSQTFTTLITSTKWDELLPEYLSFHMQSLLGLSEIERLQVGGGKGNLNAGHLADYRIDIPPLPEQHCIVGVLKAWDRGVHRIPDLIAAKLRFKQALLQQLLTGERRFPEFRDQPWTRVRLGDLLHEAERHVEWNDDVQYQLVSIRRNSGGMFFREAKYGRDIKTQVMKTTQAGDFVIARMQAVHGAMTVTPSDFDGFNVSDSYTTLVPRNRDRIWMPFLHYLSQTPFFYRLALLSSYGVTIEKMTFNLEWFLSESVLIPPTIHEQRRIAEALQSVDRELSVLQKQQDALRQQKKGLMQKLLTGQVRVKP